MARGTRRAAHPHAEGVAKPMIDLTPFEPCSLLLRDYLTRTLDVQAPGPHRERDEPVRERGHANSLL